MYNCAPDCDFKKNRNKEHLLHHIRSNIFTAITSDEVDMLPERDSFLDTTIQKIFQSRVESNDSLLFLPNQVVEKDEYTSGTLQTVIYIFGILPCGSKTCVILTDIPIYFEVRAMPDVSATMAKIRALMAPRSAIFDRYEIVKKYPLHGFHIDQVDYVRIYFKSLRDRKTILDAINAHNRNALPEFKMQTAEDDIARSDYYFAKIAREYRFKTADWNYVQDYTRDYKSTKCRYTFRVKLSGFKKLGKRKRAQLMKNLRNYLDRDNTLTASWDIETYRTIQNGQVPSELDTDFTIINICVAYFWQYSMESMLRVCILPTKIADSRPHPGISVAIYCDNETRLLSAYICSLEKMQPDILMAYNGSNFDWPLVRVKLEREGKMLELKNALDMIVNNRQQSEDSVRWNFSRAIMKLNAETRHTMKCVAKFPGLLDIDVMPIYMKMYPTAV